MGQCKMRVLKACSPVHTSAHGRARTPARLTLVICGQGLCTVVPIDGNVPSKPLLAVDGGKAIDIACTTEFLRDGEQAVNGES